MKRGKHFCFRVRTQSRELENQRVQGKLLGLAGTVVVCVHPKERTVAMRPLKCITRGLALGVLRGHLEALTVVETEEDLTERATWEGVRLPANKEVCCCIVVLGGGKASRPNRATAHTDTPPRPQPPKTAPRNQHSGPVCACE